MADKSFNDMSYNDILHDFHAWCQGVGVICCGRMPMTAFETGKRTFWLNGKGYPLEKIGLDCSDYWFERSVCICLLHLPYVVHPGRA